ncbi:MAG: helix-turn-helix transcriptional regulator [Chthoniobacterales bacterium]|nr:helix-turn-helix transcriptional regulator [Chthoniobacterales bacterium]
MSKDAGGPDKPLQRLLGGFIRLHVLHHAAEKEGVVGNWMIEELRRHGYRLSPGTLYPILHAMEEDGWLKSRKAPGGGRRRVYRITQAGRRAFSVAQERLGELLQEVAEP